MMVHWTEDQLRQLPVSKGVRLRGLEMTRLETFCDAAFAFAVTLLVIGGDGIPRSVNELEMALRGIPAFAASFATIAAFWWAHRSWSRRFGLEDNLTTVISLTMVAVMLVYVYPLKMAFSAFASFISNGWLPTEFEISQNNDIPILFMVYGFGFAAQAGLLALLNLRAKAAPGLNLNEVEKLRINQTAASFLVLGGTGFLSALFALFMPLKVAGFAGFFYMTYPISMPLLNVYYSRRVKALS